MNVSSTTLVNFGDPRLPERFWSKVQPCPMTGCWLWSAGANRSGYGTYNARAPFSGSQLAHRVSYETLIGRIGVGLELDHKRCHTRGCVNPLHLEPVIHAENVRRGDAKKAICVRGHALDGRNLMATKRGVASRCRACYEMHAKDREAKRLASRVGVPDGRLVSRPWSHCKRGHELTEANRLKLKSGGTRCLACVRMRR